MHAPTLVVSAVVLSLLAQAADTPSPALLVLNKAEATLAIIDPVTFAVVAKVPTGSDPHEVAASADGKWAFVSNYGGGGRSISVIDLLTQKERRVDVGQFGGVHGIAAMDGKAVFASESAKLVATYDPVTGNIERLVATRQDLTHMVMLNRDSTKLFTTNMLSGTVTIAERGAPGLPTAWTQTTVPVGREPEGLDLTPDGKELWTATYGDGKMAIVDVASKKVKQAFATNTRQANRVKITPDGKLALVSDMSGGELVIFDVASRKEIKRMRVGASPEGILIEPTGQRAFVAVTGDDEVAVIDLKSLSVAKRFSPGKGSGPDGMAWAKRP
jgi:DNA-binding beta-propeller fold protein YncE